MPYIAIPLLSLAVVFLGLVGAYNFVPISAFEPLSFSEPTVGATITTINGSDTLSASRTVINNNFTALNSYKIENSTTSLPLITTLAGLTSATSLSSVGTITTGTWNADVISVSKGGTGTTSPTLNLVILGNGASGFKTVNGFGTSGQFLTSNGASAAPTWQTSAVDQSITYNWTGFHSFTNGLMASSSNSNLIASTTIYTLNVGQLISTTTPTITHTQGVRAYRNAALTIVKDTLTQINFDAETYDLGSEHSAGTFTAATTGYYVIQYHVDNLYSYNDHIWEFTLYKNTTVISTSTIVLNSTARNEYRPLDVMDVVSLTAGDTIKLYASSTPDNVVMSVGSGRFYWNIFKR